MKIVFESYSYIPTSKIAAISYCFIFGIIPITVLFVSAAIKLILSPICKFCSSAMLIPIMTELFLEKLLMSPRTIFSLIKVFSFRSLSFMPLTFAACAA